MQPGGGFLEQEGQQEQLLQENQAAPMTVEADIRLDGGVNQEIVQAQETLETDTVDSNQSEQNQENERLVEETLDQKETKPAEKS